MENTRNKMALIVGAIIVILAGLWYWLTPVECLMKIKVTIGNDGVKSAVANNPTNIGFRMNGAARALNSQYHIIETARKYMRQKPDCSMEKAQKLFRCVQIEQDKADARIWNIKSVARTSEEARLIAEVYSESLIKYFRDEQVGLNRKMMSWFDQQIYHKRKRGECVAELEKVKHIVLRQEEGRAVDIVKTDEVEIKRKCSILSSGWLLFFAGESRYEGNLDFIFSYSDENAQIENERMTQQVNSSVGKFLTKVSLQRTLMRFIEKNVEYSNLKEVVSNAVLGCKIKCVDRNNHVYRFEIVAPSKKLSEKIVKFVVLAYPKSLVERKKNLQNREWKRKRTRKTFSFLKTPTR